jgi:hypothetical protein
MFLGFDDNTGLVYESPGSTPDRPVVPIPMVLQAKMVEHPDDWGRLSAGVRNNAQTWMFREDSFDAVTRTRRGRLYNSIQGAPYPNHNARVMAHAFEDPGGRNTSPDGKMQRPINVYAACTALLEQPKRGRGATLALGNNRAASAWRIVDVEITVTDDVMLVLKALSAFGVLPDLDAAKVDERFRSEVARALGRVVDSAFRESPTSVVDQCRDAAALIASRWIWQQSGDEGVLAKDLGKVALALEGEAHKRYAAANQCKTLAILHARGKSNEQFAKGARPPTEEDAEFAVHAVGLLLRELDWALSPF